MNQVVGVKKDGSPFLALALEPGNLKKLREGQPIVIRLGDLFPRGIPITTELMIAYSDTPVADARTMAKESGQVFDERSAKPVRVNCPKCESTVEQVGLTKTETLSQRFSRSVAGCLVLCRGCGEEVVITLSKEIRLPLDAVTQTLGILAKHRAGRASPPADLLKNYRSPTASGHSGSKGRLVGHPLQRRRQSARFPSGHSRWGAR